MDNPETKNKTDNSKRGFLKKAVYIAPVILTMKALPSFASSGSGSNHKLHNQGGGVFNGRVPRARIRRRIRRRLSLR